MTIVLIIIIIIIIISVFRLNIRPLEDVGAGHLPLARPEPPGPHAL